MPTALIWLAYFAVFFLVAAAAGAFLLLRAYQATWRKGSGDAFPVPRLAWLALLLAAGVLASAGATLKVATGS